VEDSSLAVGANCDDAAGENMNLGIFTIQEINELVWAIHVADNWSLYDKRYGLGVAETLEMRTVAELSRIYGVSRPCVRRRLKNTSAAIREALSRGPSEDLRSQAIAPMLAEQIVCHWQYCLDSL
jgi:hypothetical protein